MRKILFLVPVGLLFFCSIAQASSDHLWISQIQTTGGPGKTTNDFVEIFNPTAADIDLNGYRLVKRSASGSSDTSIKSWTDSTIVAAGGYYLWANSNFTDISAAPDVTTSGSISDDNGVALRLGANDTGTIIDSVAWGSSTNIFAEGSVFPTNPAVNQALVRGADTDNNAADFSIGTPNPHKSLYVTPEATPPPPPPVDPTPPPPASAAGGSGSSAVVYSTAILISEFFPNPDGADPGAEWVELYNNSSADVDLSGWFLDDEGDPGTVGSSAYSFPVNSIITAKNFMVIELPDGVFALDNTGGDTLRLVWPNKITSQQAGFTDSAPIDMAFARKEDSTYVWTTAVTKNVENRFEAPVSTKPADEKLTTEAQAKSADTTIINRPIILISELFPEPDRNSDQEEFIELYNPTNTGIDLAGLKIGDMVTWYKLTGTIPANGFFVINKSDSNISLNNSGDETVSLTNAAGDMLANVSYTDAPTEQSYNLLSDGRFVWSSELTPMMMNNIITIKVQAAIASTRSKTTTSVKTASADTGINSDTKASTVSNVIPLGQIAAASTEQVTPSSNQNSFWPWLSASFAANLLFSYILVKLMSRTRS